MYPVKTPKYLLLDSEIIEAQRFWCVIKDCIPTWLGTSRTNSEIHIFTVPTQDRKRI